MKKDSAAAILFGMVLTLVVINLLLWGLNVEGMIPFEAADNVGASIGVVLLWSFGWWSARRRSKSEPA